MIAISEDRVKGVHVIDIRDNNPLTESKRLSAIQDSLEQASKRLNRKQFDGYYTRVDYAIEQMKLSLAWISNPVFVITSTNYRLFGLFKEAKRDS